MSFYLNYANPLICFYFFIIETSLKHIKYDISGSILKPGDPEDV